METVLIISNSEKSSKMLKDLILSKYSFNINIAHSAEEAKLKILKESYELIIINTPLRDDQDNNLPFFFSKSTIAGIMVILKSNASKALADKLQEEGIITLSNPINPSLFFQGMEAGFTLYKRMVKLKKENIRMQKKLQELQIVFRAKCTLIQHFNFSEEEAHRFLEKRAMDTRESLKETAEYIIALYSNGNG